MSLLATSAGDVASYALAFFLVAVGLTLGYVFLRLGGTFGRLSSFIRGTERELSRPLTRGYSLDKAFPPLCGAALSFRSAARGPMNHGTLCVLGRDLVQGQQAEQG